ncbi:MAG: hypothetical protein GWP06_14905 [Actinobacteria bacterium]|nr:hypothetical protein [Actinomycetota bacterium]
MKHLNDQQIQAFVDGQLSAVELRNFSVHLQECSFCRKEVQAYKQLFHILEDEVDFQLSANFAHRIVSTIKSKSLGSVYNKLLSIFFGFFGIILAINISLYYVDFSPMLKDLQKNTQSIDSTHISTAFEHVTNLANRTNTDISILFFAGIVLILLALIDRFILQSKIRSA